jgi:hypothetical protein
VKLALMQPYFLPYLGYFALIRAVDRFILYDTVQYSHGGWVNRNRVLHPLRGWQYIGVPLAKYPFGTTIRDVPVADDPDWKGRLLRQLEHYRGVAPHYSEVRALLDAALDAGARRIGDLNLRVLREVCAYVGIPFAGECLSALQLELPAAGDAQARVIAIAKACGARDYVNASGGRELYDGAAFAAQDLQLSFVEMPEVPYDQRRSPFEPGLSIVDVLMFNSPGQARDLIDRHRRTPAAC